MFRSGISRDSARRSGAGGGVTSIVAGTNITITSTGPGGTGAVTINAVGIVGAASWSTLTAPTSNLTLAHSAYVTTMNWSQITGGNPVFSLNSTTTLADNTLGGTRLFALSMDGAIVASNVWTYAASIENSQTGTGSSNVGLWVSANSGDDNTAIQVNEGRIEAAADGIRFRNNLAPDSSGTVGNWTGLQASASLVANLMYTLPDAAPAVSGYVLSSTTAGVMSWVAQSGGGSTALSSLTAATASNSINNTDKDQIWTWNSFASGNAFTISSNTTLQTGSASLLALQTSGGNAASGVDTTTLSVGNSHAGTGSINYGIVVDVNNGAADNVAMYVVNGRVDLAVEGLRFLGASGQMVTFTADASASVATPYVLPVAHPGTSGFVLSSTTAGVMSWVAGSSAWSALTAPTGNLSLAHSTFNTAFTFTTGTWTQTWGAATGAGVNLFTLADTNSNSGTGFLLNLATGTSSQLKPLSVSTGGINSISVGNTGNVSFGLASTAAQVSVKNHLAGTTAHVFDVTSGTRTSNVTGTSVQFASAVNFDLTVTPTFSTGNRASASLFTILATAGLAFAGTSTINTANSLLIQSSPAADTNGTVNFSYGLNLDQTEGMAINDGPLVLGGNGSEIRFASDMTASGTGDASYTKYIGFQVDPATAIALTYTLPPTAPTTGYVLSSTATGVMSWVANGGGISGLTATRIPYASSGTTLTDSANLYWDNTNARLSVGEGATPPATFSGKLSDATTNTISTMLNLDHTSSGTTAIGFGTQILYQLKQSTLRDAAATRVYWSNVSTASANFAIGLMSLTSAIPTNGSEQLILDSFGTLTLTSSIGGVAGNGAIVAKTHTLTGSTSGSIDLKGPATGGAATYTFPATPSAGLFLKTDGAGVLSWAAASSTSLAWSALTDATGNLTLAQGTNTTTFGYATALTTTRQNLWSWNITSSGTTAAGFGGEVAYGLQSAGGTTRAAIAERYVWEVATNAAEVGSWRVGLMNAGAAIPAAGSEQFQMSASGLLSVTGGLITKNGTNALPAIMMGGDTDSGIYAAIGLGRGLGLTDNGTVIFEWGNTACDNRSIYWGPAGSVTAPSFAYRLDGQNDGFYFPTIGGAIAVAATVNGKQVWTAETQATNIIRRFTVVGGTDASIAAAASVTWGAFTVQASTLTLTGSTQVNGITSFCTINAPTLTDSSAVTVDGFASLYVIAPVAGGSVTITDSYGIYTTGRLFATVCAANSGSASAVAHSTGGVNNGMYAPSGSTLAMSVFGTQSSIFDVPTVDGDTGLQLIRRVSGTNAVGRVSWKTLASITTEQVLVIA